MRTVINTADILDPVSSAVSGSKETHPGFSHMNIPVVVTAALEQEYDLPKDGKVKQVLHRYPRHRGIPFDPHIWPERSTLRLIAPLLEGDFRFPRLVAHYDDCPVFTFTEGSVLAKRWAERSNFSLPQVEKLAAFFASMASIRSTGHVRIPRLPSDWPADYASGDFLRWHVDYTRDRVEPLVWEQYGDTLAALGFPSDAMERFASLVPRLTPRPFILLHGDLHPRNVIEVDGDGVEPGTLAVIDWELAMMGDPLHDLAIHLERSGYPNRAEEQRFIRAWQRAVGAVVPAAVRGLDQDLRWYRRFQAVRSVYTDVARTVDRRRAGVEERDDDEAAAALVRIVNRARFILRPGERAAHTRVSRALSAQEEETEATEWLDGVSCVLLDFDGPVCDLFAGSPADAVAKAVSDELDQCGLLPVSSADSGEQPSWDDPHRLLVEVGGMLRRQGLAASKVAAAQALVHSRLTASEVRAAASATATPGALGLIRTLVRAGYKVGVVSNNASAAVDAYLRLHGCHELLPSGQVFGRPENPELMKPSPYLVEQALKALGAAPEECVFIGDSVADARAAAAAGVRFLGYHGGLPRRQERLRREGVPEDRQVVSLRPLTRGVPERAHH